MGWTPEVLPDQAGRNYFITGGNSGLGFEATRMLAARGARVIIGCRSEEKANKAIEELGQLVPDATVEFVPLDLTSRDSIEAAAAAVAEKTERLDALVNNAGVMQPPLRRTEEGWELQFATNHLGHYRLSALLYPHIKQSEGRIVPVSSIAHRMGRIHFDDLQFEKSYDPTVAYGQSKLANLLFGLELHRRLQAHGSPVKSIPCHPGYAATNLQTAGVGMDGGSKLLRGLYAVTNKVMAQSAEEGAYPLLLAAADPTAKSGVYYGPRSKLFQDARGPVGESHIAKHGRDETTAKRLWEVTEELVMPFPFDA